MSKNPFRKSVHGKTEYHRFRIVVEVVGSESESQKIMREVVKFLEHRKNVGVSLSSWVR